MLRLLHVTNTHTYIPSSISSEERWKERTYTLDKKKKGLKFYSLFLLLCVSKKKVKRISIHPLTHTPKSVCVRFILFYIHVKKQKKKKKQRRKTDGSSDHRSKKVVCVCLNLALVQIIDFTQSCLIDISGSVRFFCYYLFSFSSFFSLFSSSPARIACQCFRAERQKRV
jgi:hypothetical protein